MEHLPREVLLLIAQALEFDVRTLMALTLVSKSLSVLYKGVLSK